MCELVMLREDMSKQLCDSIDVFPIIEDSDDDDDDDDDKSDGIEYDLDSSLRLRANTTLRMEKTDIMKKKVTKTKNIKWEASREPPSDDFLDDMFSKKELITKPKQPFKSLLSVQLETYVPLPKNPYQEYAKFDGSAQVELPARKYKIFLTMLPEDERNYPMTISCIVTATILQLIGLICYKCR